MPTPSYDETRIQGYHDKRLLGYVRAYFNAFTSLNFEGLRDLQTEDYLMTDVPLGIVRVNRDEYYNINKGFSSLTADPYVVALSLTGSSAPGSHSIMECTVNFRLIADPPPSAAEHLPAGAKAGDMVHMLNLSVLWWGKNGKVTRQFEYGRLVWSDFNIGDWDETRKTIANKYTPRRPRPSRL
jgi:hypothetical protein